MNIGIICYPTFGGSGVVATELGKALANQGHNLHFITYNHPVRLEHFHTNISYHEVRIPKYPLFQYQPYETALASKLVDVAMHDRLDLVHVHYAVPHASAAYLAKQILKEKGIQLPVVTTLHGTDITLVGKDSTYAPVVEFSINHSDGVTTVSESLKSDTLNHFNIVKEIEVIPNFVDFNRFTISNKEHFKKAIAPGGEKVLIHVSNFRKVKRVEDVVYVFQKIHNEIPCRLLMVGDGPERNNVENLCRNMGICDDIRFLGKQEAVEELLAVSDVFLLPSESESFGLAALEAMACGVPIISTNTGGLPEINIHGTTGYLSNVGDIDEMSRFVIDLLENEEKLSQFKKNAVEQAMNFDIKVIMPRYEQFYHKILNAVTV